MALKGCGLVCVVRNETHVGEEHGRPPHQEEEEPPSPLTSQVGASVLPQVEDVFGALSPSCCWEASPPDLSLVLSCHLLLPCLPHEGAILGVDVPAPLTPSDNCSPADIWSGVS